MSIGFDHANHAYVIIGNPEEVVDSHVKPTIEQELQVSVIANPDVVHTHHPSFGIDDARRMRDLAIKRAAFGTQVFIVSFDAITVEAQNALLKTLEEPTKDTYFFIVVSSSEVLLPTVLSRARLVVAGDSTLPTGNSEFAREVLAASLGERLSLVKELLEEKDKVQILRLLDSLESQLYQELVKQGTKYTKVFYEIMVVRGYLRDRSPSVKMLLEHILLMLPVIPMEKPE